MFTTDNRFVAELYINPTLEIGKKYGLEILPPPGA